MAIAAKTGTRSRSRPAWRSGRWLGDAMLALACGMVGDAANATVASAPPPQPARQSLPPAAIDNTLAIGGEDIGGKEVSTRMTVAVQVNGHGPFRFVVDSGADSSVIGSRIAQALRLPATTPVRLNGMTASVSVDRVKVDALGLGPGSIRDVELPVLRDQDLGADGMIGIDALVEQRLMLDFDKRLIRVEDARQPSKYLDGEIVVTARRRRGQLILTQASVNGGAVDAVIDTGSEITIGNLALRDRLARRHPDAIQTIAVTGVTGVTVDLQLIRVPELRLGPVTLRDVPIAFADVPPFDLFGLSKQPALLLGTDLMESFRRVSLDFRARKVRFQLRRCRSTGITVRTSAYGSFDRFSSLSGGSEACTN